MRIDLHVHTRFSPDSFMDLEVLARRCAETGLDCIAVTDHNTIDGALEMQRLAPFPVIVGEEIKSSGGEIIGLFLREAVPRGLPPLETVWLVKEQGGLVSVPHPFDHFRRSVIERAALQEILPHVDIIEAFNARNTLQRDNRSAEALALEHGILTSSVTDSHTPVEVGRCYVETPAFDLTPAGLLEGLARGTQVRRQMLPLIHFATTVTKTRKRLAGLLQRG